MRRHRFIGNFDLNQKDILIKDWGLIGQVKNVFRLTAGNSIILSNGRAEEADAVILNFKSGMLVELGPKRKVGAGANRSVLLYASLLKGDHFEMIVEKTTEIGVEEIIPIITNRIVKKSVNEERMLKIIKEAGEQSGRGVLTRLAEPMTFEKAVADALFRTDVRFFCEKGGEHWSGLLPEQSSQKTAIFVGPEGGWNNEEKITAREKKFVFINLGDLTLRAETAAIVVSFIFASRRPQ